MLNKISFIAPALTAIALFAGCSHSPKVPDNAATSGPRIINPRSNPDKIELNAYLEPQGSHEILADVQDFTAPVTEVNVQIENPATVLKMEKVGGSTWRAVIPEDLLKRMGVNGQTMDYEATVVARNQQGQSVTSEDSFTIHVEAPEVTAVG
jgi:hypothetical protein